MASKKKARKIKPASKLLKVKKAKTTAANGKTPIPAQVRIETKAKEQVTISKAKGRPMLTWVGKRPLRAVTAFPAQHIESFAAPDADKAPMADAAIWKDWPEKYPRGGLLFHGDNKEVLAHLLANGFRGQVQLIYIDPPFDSGADYVRKVMLRGPKGASKLEGENYTLGEQIQYTDIWANDNYLQFMYERLILMRELLVEGGAIFVHCDWRKHHHLRCVLDEVFGPDAFRNEVVVKRGRRKNLQSQFEEIDALGSETDAIMIYCRTGGGSFSKVQSEIRATPAKWKDFWRGNVDRPSMRYAIPWLDFLKPTRGQLLWAEERGLRAAQNYQEFLHAGGGDLEGYWRAHADEFKRRTGYKLEFVNWDGTHIIKYWIPPKEFGVIGNLWADIEAYSYKHDYKTEKHEALLTRIIEMATDEGDLILDCFVGSGTTAAVAQMLGRRWIGCDINKGAIQTTTNRLQGIISAQIKQYIGQPTQERLPAMGYESDAEPTELTFTVWRVNDYDLSVQHNEAVNLACEHIGVTRTLADAFFDGALGSKLVKIIPFGHPLSPADLEDVKRELDARANESRDVVVVCLGKELSVDAWLAEWNRMRKQGDTPNKIEVIELRSDPKYGKFIAHKPAQARVDIRRVKDKDGDKLVVEVKDFISPAITERLQAQADLLSPKISDWRAMVDSVMIDPAHDGKVFNIALADVPERKQDYVQGRYELPTSAAKTTVAVKITDMLGEEIIVTAHV